MDEQQLAELLMPHPNDSYFKASMRYEPMKSRRLAAVLMARYGGDTSPSLKSLEPVFGVSGSRILALEYAGLRRLRRNCKHRAEIQELLKSIPALYAAAFNEVSV